MQQKTREAIETFLKKAGFWKLSGKDVWCESKVPNQKVCDMIKDPPWIGISTGVGRIEAENSGIALIQDYKEKILQIYNSSEHQNEKPLEAGSHIPAPPQEQEVSEPPPNSIPVPVSGGESHPFICSTCKTPISAEQRAATVKAVGKALCEACIHKTAEELAEKMKPKDEPVTLFHAYACYDCPTMMTEQEGKASEKKYGFPVCKVCSELRDAKTAAKETKKKSAGKKKEAPAPEASKEELICPGCNQPISKCTEQFTYCLARIKQGVEPIKPAMCKDCGFELSHIRALEYQICEGCAETRKVESEKTVPLKPREKIMNEKTEPKDIIPAGKPGANAPAPKSDHERDQAIEKAKAKRYLEGQGGSYKVNGTEVPDSARIQQIANEENISVMILESEQNEEFARVRVRGILKGQSVDDEVWVDFDTELKLLMMEFIRKNEGVLDHFDGLNPVFKEGAKIKNFDGSFTDAKYALVHAMLTLRKFAVRSASTKAAKRVQMKLMNKEFREKEEIADEQAEKDLVDSKKRK